jgi:hypothetical protein
MLGVSKAMANRDTISRRDQIFDLFAQGFPPKSREVKALGMALKTRYNYFSEWKREFPELHQQLFSEEPEAEDDSGNGSELGSTPAAPPGSKPTAQAKEKKATLGVPGGGPITVGRITITPENWGMTQEGAILIIDTFNKAKKDIGYDGTIGEFICDVMKVYRRIQNY